MVNQVSPGVEIREIDNFLTIPPQTNNIVAYAAPFSWGPVSTPVYINSSNIRAIFGKPTDNNFSHYLLLKGFLDYDGVALCTRIDTTNLNAVSDGSGVKIKNSDHYETLTLTQKYIARYPGTVGNSLKVSVCPANNTAFNAWAYKSLFDSAPATSDYTSSRNGSNDELHIVVIDEDGKITGTAGTILEKFQYLSQAADCKIDGEMKYYKDYINQRSNFIWVGAHESSFTEAGENASGTTFIAPNAAINYLFTSGTDDFEPSTGETIAAYNLYSDIESYDIGIILGPVPTNDSSGISVSQGIANICSSRADVVGVLSAPVSAARTSLNPQDEEISFFDNIESNSYVTFAHNALYMEDLDNNKFRWVPTGGQVAGTMVYTDRVANEWSSPAGYNRGQIRSALKLAYSPDLSQRETLYKARINPIIKTKNSGIILYGNKTGLSRPSSTQSLNIRRLFNYIKKKYRAIAKFMVFELNNASTRISLVNTLEPDLSEIRARGGIYDYRIVCNETNNTPFQIDSGNLIAYVDIKPTRVAERVKIDLISTPTGLLFNESF